MAVNENPSSEELLARLKTPEDCEQFAINVAKRRPDDARKAKIKAIQLRALAYGAGTDAEREAIEAILAYEQVLTQKNGRKTRATRTWQAIKKHGIVGAIELLVTKDQEQHGYTTLVEMGMGELAFEEVVKRHPGAFSEAAVKSSQQRLAKWSA